MEVKNYMVKGRAKFNTDKFPIEQQFTKYVRAVNKKEAIEKVYSHFGSKNGIRRDEIKITSIEEISLEQVPDKRITDLASMSRVI
ncbi:50S ribosomal protein LX [Sulfodiicoccus acidiphilus]|uniref:Large ribosomal subunit protein eL20 n=1 Tax=Sulfodiicoccus acidiphilus TaxID=1670455 RepID=A0A348B301_9CREN|nr:50S ribosomal protein L18Ae [Sulfodiicoccus acidiphilus]BBD72553.1 50S ribosomal protein LX [Sulfodiicoccus acidiphilus]GGT93707.1 50S ribosomal protein LX [Sulfodiicoccus acidiphilus]